jgi:hypothetical protein
MRLTNNTDRKRGTRCLLKQHFQAEESYREVPQRVRCRSHHKPFKVGSWFQRQLSWSNAHTDTTHCSIRQGPCGVSYHTLHNFILTLSSIRAKVNAGDNDYLVTAEDVPSFLYEDPLKYNPENVFTGLLRGRFLICICEMEHPCTDIDQFYNSVCVVYS